MTASDQRDAIRPVEDAERIEALLGRVEDLLLVLDAQRRDGFSSTLISDFCEALQPTLRQRMAAILIAQDQASNRWNPGRSAIALERGPARAGILMDKKEWRRRSAATRLVGDLYML